MIPVEEKVEIGDKEAKVDSEAELHEPCQVNVNDESSHSIVENNINAISKPTGIRRQDILYRVWWCEHNGDPLQSFDSHEPFTRLEVANEFIMEPTYSREDKPIIEVMTEIRGPHRSIDMETHGYRRASRIEDIMISSVRPTTLFIHSDLLMEILRSIISYYPSQQLGGDPIIIKEPYQVLIHHMDDLKALDRANAGSADEGGEAGHHLRVLLNFLQPTLQNVMFPIQERLSRDPPVITFDTLWYLFRPGTDFYIPCQHSERWTGATILDTALESFAAAERRGSEKRNYIIDYFVLGSDGRSFRRDEAYVCVKYFEGEQEVAKLPIIPSSVWDRIDGGERRRALEASGKKAYDLQRAGHTYMRYTGDLYSAKRIECNDVAVVVDTYAALRYSDPERDRDFRDWTFLENPIPATKGRWEMYDNLDFKKNPTLSAHQYFLTQPLIAGYVLKDKQWRIFDVDCLHEVTSEEIATRNLVLSGAHMELLRAVCETQKNKWKVDFIESKGDGHIILLHGPPGVGKTYTVESLAISTGRPLISLSEADIGLDDAKMESNLVRWFIIAESWNAMLLFDEADIFMEQRRRGDLSLNALVSMFLRRIEYFKGLFFLTTNRIGQIDDSFISRVSLVVGYEPLTDDKRKQIWKGFFDKLQSEMERRKREGKTPVIEISKYAKQYLTQDDEVKQLQWNGRDIRNALQTAISLATYQAALENGVHESDIVDVEVEHFQSVVRMSGKFHQYMDSITGKGEADRARMRYDRNDKFGHKKQL